MNTDSARSVKEVLRLRFHAQLSIRKIRSSTNLSVGAIQKIIQQAEQPELSWPLPPDVDEAESERRFYPSTTHATVGSFEQPDFVSMHPIEVRLGVVGGSMFMPLMNALHQGGRYSSLGAIAGPSVEFDLRQLTYKDVQMTGAIIVPRGTFCTNSKAD